MSFQTHLPECLPNLKVMDVVLYDMATNKPTIQFDSLKTSSISVTSEKVYARGGKGNPKLMSYGYTRTLSTVPLGLNAS